MNAEGTQARAAWTLACVYGAVMLVLGLIIASAELPVLLDRFMPDDAFYYYKPAQNFAQTGFSSFDGIHFTNGYQPLWFLVSVPVFWIFPEGGETPVRLLLYIQLALATTATMLLVRTVGERFGVLSTAIAFAVWILVMQRTMLNGLETALTMFCYALLFRLFTRFCRDAEQRPGGAELLILGIVAGLAFLARTDSAFLVIGLLVFLAVRTGVFRLAGLKRLVCFVIPVALLAGGYLGSNLLLSGHLTPVSGAAKVFHSSLQRDAVIGQTGSVLAAYLENWSWSFVTASHRFVVVGLVGPWLVVALSFLRRFARALGPLRVYWPFYFGATFSWMYYATAFWGGFSSTLWYYGPHAFLACLLIAGIGQAAEGSRYFGRVPGAVAGLCAAFVMAWLTPITLLIGFVVWALMLFVVGRGVTDNLRRLRPVIVWVLAIGWLVAIGARGNSSAGWLLAVAVSVGLLAIVLWLGRRAKAVLLGATTVVLATMLLHAGALRRDVAEPPFHWNYNLYRGALWARDNLPVDATIWSGSAGILGYFSERTTVNTDGLANSYDFLENVLKKGRLAEYYKNWDYAIDAFPDEVLAEMFPEGRFLELPEELRRLGFEGSGGHQRLGVFQMVAAQDSDTAPPPEFWITGPAGEMFPVGQTVTIRWTAANIRPHSAISLCYDEDQSWGNGNEHWIVIDRISATGREGSYKWDTTDVLAGKFFVGGYLYDGRDTWTLARAPAPITLVDQ